MTVESFTEIIGADFYTGVPDSQLKALCNYLMDTYGIDEHHHLIGANEGNCVALAAGYHLATGRVPVVYMQNSGEGNIVNPVASLLHEKVYGIPMIFVVGWRGEPGVHDEPQHIYQGEITLKLLEDMGIRFFVIEKDTTQDELKDVVRDFKALLLAGKDVAFVVRKGALSYAGKKEYRNDNIMKREEIIRHIVSVTGDDPVICTTGKASRELFEIREETEGSRHQYDFLTVGSMGHSSSIALGIAINKPDKKIWCIDGDGAALMHMGAMAVIGSVKPANFVHVIINNESHETVGGMPTVAGSVDFVAMAKACGYPHAVRVDSAAALEDALAAAKARQALCMIEVKAAIGARQDLGRPTTTALENKRCFMDYLNRE
ncbi:MAG: phosphonopyruvate decarboxylase [Lachnospiraceae bacterium]|nr:phosphonopyruvate decarboxylase [Lachnospiraceae bacterium]